MALAEHLRRGQQAERSAENLLRASGHRILARNVRYSCGEIDLVTRHQNTIVFVEVRERNSSAYGRPEETVDRHKQRRLLAAAQLWLQHNDPGGQFNCRFDIIGILAAIPKPEVRWLQNAFEAEW